MREHIEDIRYVTRKQFDRIEKYADTEYKIKCAKHAFRVCQKYIFCHAKNISWNSTVWYLERLYLETYRINPSSPIKIFSFMDIEEKENRIYVQEYMKYCLGITHFNYKYYLKKEILHHIILFALGIFVTLISYFISSRIMEKKNFKKDSCRFLIPIAV